ncbi:glycosyltransferase [Haloferax namakaokahaiae]|uniref:Glycosyltransferase n=1 Tax=Haloferax namakaokahaiae TaxID=1748331 RepID=A0ABD5ZJI4_9EURY
MSEMSPSADGQNRATGEATDPTISVVIPTLNEEENIETCLDSVFDALQDGPSFEVILVDSNSEDSTVERARQYPITVLQITEDDLTTPGAGRYVGWKVANGDLLLFVDGDMQLTGDWVRDAHDTIESEPNVSGVDGYLDRATSAERESVNAINGVMLYDAAVLDEVETFDPFLQGYEDIILGFQLRAAGYDLLRLPIVSATHARPYEISQLKRRWNNGYMYGLGQVVRKSLTSPKILKLLLIRNLMFVLFLLLFSVGVATFVVSRILFVGWVLMATSLFLADSLWEGPSFAAERWIRNGISWYGFCRGFLMTVRAPSEFPLDAVETIADGTTHGPGIESAPKVSAS